jgi:putative spermidine/putrescine transport system permease protein
VTALPRRAGTAAGWAVLLVLTGLPLLTIAVQAFARGWFFPDLVPGDWTAEQVRRLVEDPRTRSAFTDSLRVSVLATALAMALAVPAARALALGRMRRAGPLAAAFLVPTVLPPVALAMGLNVAVLRAGAEGGVWTVAVAHLVVTLPYGVLILTAALTRYDATLERQAAVLGAGPRRILLRVFLPVAAPALATTAALVFVVSWGQYLLTLLPGAGRVTTMPVLVLAASTGGNPTATAALALATAVPPAVAVLLVVRHLDALAGGGRR